MEKIVGFLLGIAHSDLFLLTITVVIYFGAQWIYSRYHSMFLNPMIISSAIIIVLLKVTGVEFEEYYEANGIINFMLGFSVVSLGYLLHTNIEYIKSVKFSILTSIFIGSVVGVLSVMGMAWLFGFDEMISISLQPKSVTTPIALSLSQNSGGIAALTSLAVVVTGIFGNAVGPEVLRLFGVKDSVARGLALGAASHAVGTARAMELGALEGAVGGAAIGLMGVMTSLVLPILNQIFG